MTSKNKKPSPSWNEWKFDLARRSLLAIQRQEGSKEANQKGIVVANNVSVKTYIYEVPLDPHAMVQGELSVVMGNWNRRLLSVIGEVDIIVGPRSVYRPDLSIRPNRRQRPPFRQAINSSGNPYPTMVVEIGNTESVRSLHELVAGYFSPRTTIQIYLAIKLFPPRQDGLYLRNNQNPIVPTIAKSFGTAPLHVSVQNYLHNFAGFPADGITGVGFGSGPCNGANLPDYQIAIPTISLFNGVIGGVPNGVPNNFSIDLWDLHDAILNRL
ncbi:10227_t:CDS:2 [Ambispora gerdemannii]|uniref:10227_t:CDS:1 n=1 Tax=Ambispora gerdemannii TaxID=144530 RepID=A0A9N8VKN0_9GLOM|nr:10227_t:CDS:2 [Ambispora gerdemannii]